MRSRARINDEGAIVGTATKTSDGTTHSVLLLPCQFSLLNGDQSGPDGMDFDGNRPMMISQTSNYITPQVINADIGHTFVNGGGGNDGMDIIGIDSPLGRGRPDFSGNCYTFSLILLAKVSPPTATNISYSWDRAYEARDVSIVKMSNATSSYWYVKAINSDNLNYNTRSLPILPTGIPTLNEDFFYETNATSTPSSNNVISSGDSPAMLLTEFYGNAPNINDYVYEKRRFTNLLTIFIGSASTVAIQQVGTNLVAQRIAKNGTVAGDWRGVRNIASTRNVLDCSGVTEAEIQAIVFPDTSQIVFDPNVNKPDPVP